MENEIIKVEEMIAPAINEPLFDTQITTAKRYPRNIMKVMDNAIATVTRNENTAASCGYALPRAGKQIQGASVHLARIIAQFYGNIRVQVKAGEVSATHVTASAIAFDLESNYAIQVDARRKILKKDGKRYDEDMINTTMLAAMAVAERNAIYKVIPQALIDEVYQASRKKLTGDLSDEQKLISKRKEVFEYFLKTYDVSEKDILEMFGKKTIATITPDDIATLRGVVQAIKDGDTTIEEQFPRFRKEENKEENKKLFDKSGND
jgi:hypothetical protein